MSSSILPPDSELYGTFQEIAATRRCVFFAGLPGTGKSLFLQQMALMATEADRTVHLLQYDVARPPFETAENLLRYPEIDGFTHAAIRKAVGLWARAGVWNWHQSYPDPSHMLVGEVPLVGNRLVELAQKHSDDVESLLSGEGTSFLLPVPSIKIRRLIESARDKSMSKPRHEREKQDAPPNVLRALWGEIARIGYELGLTSTEPGPEVAYDPSLYAAVYRHLLRYRRLEILAIDNALNPTNSAYDLEIGGTELIPETGEVDRIMRQIERTFTPESLELAVENWYAM